LTNYDCYFLQATALIIADIVAS